MIILSLFVLGLILGSFVNALVWRIHEQAKSKKKRADKRYSIWVGRSMCTHCGHELVAKDLVPLFSWLLLRGRCRYCRAKISAQYPLVEILTALLFAAGYIVWPYGSDTVGMVMFFFFVPFVVLFMALAVYDVRWFLLPNRLVFTLTFLAAAQVGAVALVGHDIASVWQPVVGAALLYGIFWGLYQVSAGRWIGGGDVKLALPLGLIVGTPLGAFLVLFFASLLGTVVSLPLIARGKKGLTQHIPFGPYLLAACYIVLLFGDRIVAWYTGMLM